ncbi:hypothetical protein Cri9333_4887 (plasmid) [Crinalium epipsammum PCC 9333]|uniref:Uncharacterized protein n=1 Tax=Crinalium epipsammum PCC 9333 TaxID=1173022 RepID=K9W861_9CYAN|nr:hypothetical protein [Crinalium epipsammum]AFZ15650.1 hypothetical protein Cri9333_4887 [Crinalium epipsammum PCC 9333]
MTETTTQPENNYIPQEDVEIDPVTAYCNWVLGKPFKDSIAKLDKAGVIAYVNHITSSLTSVQEPAKSFWKGYKAGILGTEKLADDEIFAIGYDAALGIVKPPLPKRKPKNVTSTT